MSETKGGCCSNLQKLEAPDGLKASDISSELWREYDFGGRVYRIEKPKALFSRCGGTTHRVCDDNGVVHCVPAPGHNGCVLRWQSKDTNKPVVF